MSSRSSRSKKAAAPEDPPPTEESTSEPTPMKTESTDPTPPPSSSSSSSKTTTTTTTNDATAPSETNEVTGNDASDESVKAEPVPDAEAPVEGEEPEEEPETPKTAFDLLGTAVAALKNVSASSAAASIATNKWDTDAWTALISYASQSKIEAARPVYEAFFEVFPTAGKQWKSYAEQELKAGNAQAVQKIFERSLMKCHNVDLWKYYLHFVKLVNKDQENAREELTRAYEFVVEHIGEDIGSNLIWTEYIQFLKDAPSSSATEDSNKIAAVRRVYQRAVQVPMHLIEGLWREYESWETGNNKTLANSIFKELAPRYNRARQAYRERRAVYEAVQRPYLSHPPPYANHEKHALDSWRRVIAWERNNSQILQAAELKKRLGFVFEQAIANNLHSPEIWYGAISQAEANGDTDAAATLYERALETLPDCLLIAFGKADFEENRKNFPAASAVYQTLLSNAGGEPLVYIQFMRFARRTEGVAAARRVFYVARKCNAASWQVYLAAAHMEHYVNKEPDVARRIFISGMNTHGREPEFVLAYLDWFMAVENQDHNVRQLFESALQSLPVDRALPVWKRFLEFEYMSGASVSAISRLEARVRDAYPKFDPSGIKAGVMRYRFHGLAPVEPWWLNEWHVSGGKTNNETPPNITYLAGSGGMPLLTARHAGMGVPHGTRPPMAPGGGHATGGMLGTPGGPPLPNLIRHLMSRLPGASTMRAAAPVNVNMLIDLLMEVEVPNTILDAAMAERAGGNSRRGAGAGGPGDQGGPRGPPRDGYGPGPGGPDGGFDGGRGGGPGGGRENLKRGPSDTGADDMYRRRKAQRMG